MLAKSDTQPGRVEFAHALRGVAALSVVVSHFVLAFWTRPAAIEELTHAPAAGVPSFRLAELLESALLSDFLGHFGVATFFLISGFVIPFGLIGRRRRDFAVARFFRIWPTYAVGLTIAALMVMASASWYGRPLAFGWSTYLMQLLFVRDLFWVPSIDGIVWTLEIEFKFYVLMLVMAPAISRGSWGALLAAVLLMATATAMAAQIPGWLTRADAILRCLYGLAQSAQMISFMCAGVTINFLFRRLIGLPVALALILVCLAATTAQWLLGPLAPTAAKGIPSYLIALGCFAMAYANRQRFEALPRGLNWLANISYPLYVIHAVPGYVLMRVALDAGIGAAGSILIAFAWAFAGAQLLHRFVEVPTHEFGRALTRRNRRTDKPVARHAAVARPAE